MGSSWLWRCLSLLILVNICVPLKYQSYEQTRYENGKVNRVVSLSKMREDARRDKLEAFNKFKNLKKWKDRNRERVISFDLITDPDSEAIVSLYLRRSSFVKIKPKSQDRRENGRLQVVTNEWVYYKDFRIKGNAVSSFLFALKHDLSGIREENAKKEFECLLATFVAASNSTLPIFTPVEAYKELISLDPSIAQILPPRNLEFGYSMKFQHEQKKEEIEERLKILNRPVLPLAVQPMPNPRLLMASDKMDFLSWRIDRSQPKKNLKPRILAISNALGKFANSLSSYNRVFVAIDGSALYYDYENQKDLCASAGIIFVPDTVESTKQLNSSLQFCIRPIFSDLSKALDAELISFVSALSLLNILFDRLNQTGVNNCTFEILTDSKTVCKLFRDIRRDRSNFSSLGSSGENTDIIKRLCQTQLFETEQLIEILRSQGVNISLSCDWIRGHPELRDQNPRRWDMKESSHWLSDKIAEVAFYDVSTDFDAETAESSFLKRYFQNLQEKDFTMNEFCQVQDCAIGENLLTINFSDLIDATFPNAL